MPAIRVDPNWVKSVYLQIADDVQHRIETDEIKFLLPGERAMAEDYGAAIMTVRRAMRELRERGVIETIPARGSFVASALAARRSEASRR